ncbi:RNA-directed DNA polymerase, eukaryota, partial [Tanacetum coccineum]
MENHHPWKHRSEQLTKSGDKTIESGEIHKISLVSSFLIMGVNYHSNHVSKEDLTHNISKSVFVTNFPDHFTSRDLWNVCVDYGNVVDVFIPHKKLKAGKRFAFVRYIKVVNLECLIGNLCTIWIGRHHLHANAVRFQREPLKTPFQKRYEGAKPNSFASVLKSHAPVHVKSDPPAPVIVLDDECLKECDLSCSLLGKLKNFKVIPNIHAMLENEGFPNVNVTYMGGLWVLLTSDVSGTKEKLSNHKGVSSWFFEISSDSELFVSDERVIWVSFEGLPLKVMTHNTYSKIISSWDNDSEDEGNDGNSELHVNEEDLEEGEVNHVSESSFMHENSTCRNHAKTTPTNDDPKFPPGFTPDIEIEQGTSENFQAHQTGGSFLEVMDELVSIGQTMVILWRGCLKNIETIIGSQESSPLIDEFSLMSISMSSGHKAKKRWIQEINHKYGINFLAIKETKSANIKLFDIKAIWGNYSFDFVISDAIGYLGGNLCIWDPNVFVKDNVTASDSFLAIRGTWLLTSSKLLIISVYAPQDPVEKRMLWEYFLHIIQGWEGEYVHMGDFNEVRSEHERFEMAQKAKVRWAIEGDENSKFFHGVINKKRSQLAIRGVLVDGEWISETAKVRNEFLMHFSNRFSAPPSSKLSLDSQFDKVLSKEQNDDFERPISKEEIKSVVWDCTFSQGCNSSFIALIPKMQDAKLVKDFRPISLIRCIYKIVTKILDGPFIHSELLSWCKQKKFQSLIFKVDFEKAFDSIRKDYIDEVLLNFRFGSKWRGWINGCLSSSMGSVLVNGSPTTEFKFYKGLKQGDPLSQFLFILVMERLHLAFTNVLNAGIFKGVTLNELLTLSHFFFADDAIFVGKWEVSNISAIVNVLNIFHMASGLKINIHKSKLMGVGVSKEEVDSAAKVPMGVLNNMEAIRRNFLNGVEKADRKICWIGWKKVLAAKKNGGLGVSSYFAFNRALLFKWYWRFKSNESSLWARVIKAIHGINGSINGFKKPMHRSPWSVIICEINSLANKGINLLQFVKKKTGNGEDTRFWKDTWHSDVPLKNLYPRVFALEIVKDVTVAGK